MEIKHMSAEKKYATEERGGIILERSNRRKMNRKE